MQQIHFWIGLMLTLVVHPTKSFRVGGPFLQSTFHRGSSFAKLKSHSSSPLWQSSTTKDEQEEAPKTMYTIDCPPTAPNTLEDVVTKHCLTLNQFEANKPIANHTLEAFQKVQTMIPGNATLVLDSGCGTGRSTRHLASILPPEVWVLGIDRSLVRLERNQGNDNWLERNQGYRLQQQKEDMVWKDEVLKDLVWQDKKQEDDQTTANALWIRAELVDFWRLLLQHQDQNGWKVDSHYLLYPNPYPKPKRLKSRWYGHPSFPLISQLGGDKIVLRSNWKTYLEEFAQAVLIADQSWSRIEGSINYAKPYVESAQRGPVRREPAEEHEGWSNFEIKMDKAGEPTYELDLTRSQ